MSSPRRSSPSLISWFASRTCWPASQRNDRQERAVGANGIERRQSVLARDLAVDLTEGRRLVHESGTVVGRDVVRAPRRSSRRALGKRHVSEGPLVVQADERRARKGRGHDGALAEDASTRSAATIVPSTTA